jgi:peptide/nickel transport system ATP-binding protein
MALVLISHDLGVIAETCDRVASCMPAASSRKRRRRLFEAARHPYAQGLLGSLPPLAGPRRRLDLHPRRRARSPCTCPGCAFAPRCSLAEPRCTRTTRPDVPPGLRRLLPGRRCRRPWPAAGRPAVPASVAERGIELS